MIVQPVCYYESQSQSPSLAVVGDTVVVARFTLLHYIQHWHKCKSTIDCSIYRSTHSQHIASFPGTPVQRTACSGLQSIHRDEHVGLWNYLYLAAGDGSIITSLLCLQSLLLYRYCTLSLGVRLSPFLSASLGACMRQLCKKRSRVFHEKLLADGAPWVCGIIG